MQITIFWFVTFVPLDIKFQSFHWRDTLRLWTLIHSGGISAV